MNLIIVALALALSWMYGCRAANDSSTTTLERSSSKDRNAKAISIPPSEYFEGNDGPWSTFNIRVGTPEQDVRVLVSTTSPESMVVLSEYGCSTLALATVPSDCAVSRGNLFNPNESSSWNDLGLFGINQDGVGLEANLGYSQRVEFALETLGLGFIGPKLDNQTVAGLAAADYFYLGVFGLNTQPVNFSTLGNTSSTSFLTTLKDKGVVPSLSWSYTAGAKYRLKQVYGQLILSGYDTSRFTENSVSFTMADDLTRDLVVALQSISYSGSSSMSLLSDSIQIFLDSTEPNIWLPESTCDAFEEAFGLTLDPESGLYLVNETHHNTLLDSNAEVSFRLSDVNLGGDTVRVILPYNAFDLTAKYPLVDNSSYYFPLKRAANASQYTLGRTFLQEAYLSADYERGVFNVSACKWDQGAQENIVTIQAKDSDDDSDCSATGNGCPSGSKGSTLSNGVIAGIVVGVIIAVLLAGFIAFMILRQRKKAAYAASEPEPDMTVINGPIHNVQPTPPAKYYSPETVGDSARGSNAEGTSESVSEGHGNELDGHNTEVVPGSAVDDNGPRISELHGDSRQPDHHGAVYHELAGSSVRRREPDGVSMSGTLSSYGERGDIEEPPSPFVSTLGTAGWQDELGNASSALVSPTTPVNREARYSSKFIEAQDEATSEDRLGVKSRG
ncbi:hypothetical protein JX266_005420 [Neoarthrinium moseri]|uniref:uncharacterized protein n=1 Tax=Neoarthrinium moseri TaxID=1658444 RepID=UPI001FDE21A0|nr:uncharacterized protein JN550_013620 [Neoarthrinium moseri]KAI1848561.1 hypothetical protein JX266_005420 [Neoarthrinium moseri]KAI1856875.1 hypothetical protein JN550_013620 [Neoarthrinium moseri]